MAPPFAREDLIDLSERALKKSPGPEVKEEADGNFTIPTSSPRKRARWEKATMDRGNSDEQGSLSKRSKTNENLFVFKRDQLFEVETGMGNGQETPAPALDVHHPAPGSQTTSTDASSLPLQSGPATASPHFHRLPGVPRAYRPSLAAEAAEAAQTRVRCVKLLKSEPDHRCRRTHRYRKCEYCTKIKKPCVSIPRPLRSNVAHLLKHRTDADFAQQAERVGEEMEAYIRHDHREAGGELAQLVHLGRCVNRNLFRIANALQGAADGEEYEEEDEEVEEVVFSGAVA